MFNNHSNDSGSALRDADTRAYDSLISAWSEDRKGIISAHERACCGITHK
jgi:hypothetical protein